MNATKGYMPGEAKSTTAYSCTSVCETYDGYHWTESVQ